MTTLIVILLGLLIGFYLYAKERPDTFRLERSIIVNAPAEKIFPLINDFHSWVNWSPWEKLDPNMQRTYEGTPSGVGTKYGWTGKGQVGTGSMEITKTESPSSVTIKLDFMKPFEAHNTTVFTLVSKDAGTEVVLPLNGLPAGIYLLRCGSLV